MRTVSRQAFSLVELLVVVAIVGVLVSLLLPAIQRVHKSSQRTICGNRLRQIGVAVHNYHEAIGFFPSLIHGVPKLPIPNVFHALKPFLEEQNNNGNTSFETFLCPGRRGAEVGPKCDFGGIAILNNPVIFSSSVSPLLVDFNDKPPVKIDYCVDGTSNTLILAHKGLDPKFYHSPCRLPAGTTNPQSMAILPYHDDAWKPQNLGDSIWAIQRFGLFFGRDDDQGHDVLPYWEDGFYPGPKIPCYELMTSPHTSMLCLRGDGSVWSAAYSKKPVFSVSGTPGMYTLGGDSEILYHAWMMNDGAQVDLSIE